MKTPLPTREELLDARDWLLRGAPAVMSRNAQPKAALRVLLRLIEALPQRIPEYRWDYKPKEGSR